MLAERGGGSIINTASIAGLNGLMSGASTQDIDLEVEEGAGAYVAAKHGVVGITRQFAVTYGPRGVRVNAVCPGYIHTPMTAAIRDMEGAEEFLASLHPVGPSGSAGRDRRRRRVPRLRRRQLRQRHRPCPSTAATPLDRRPPWQSQTSTASTSTTRTSASATRSSSSTANTASHEGWSGVIERMSASYRCIAMGLPRRRRLGTPRGRLHDRTARRRRGRHGRLPRLRPIPLRRPEHGRADWLRTGTVVPRPPAQPLALRPSARRRNRVPARRQSRDAPTLGQQGARSAHPHLARRRPPESQRTPMYPTRSIASSQSPSVTTTAAGTRWSTTTRATDWERSRRRP